MRRQPAGGQWHAQGSGRAGFADPPHATGTPADAAAVIAHNAMATGIRGI